MGNLVRALINGLKNPKIQRIIVIALIVIGVLAILINASPKVKKFWNKLRYGVQGDNVYAPISDLRQGELEKLASDLYKAIYSWWDTATDSLGAIKDLNDSEFLYIVEYYERFLSENKMYYDIDWEVLPETENDDAVLARLKEMNLA